MHWRDQEWWHLQQAIGQHIDPTSSELQWRHARPGRNLQWEDVLVEIFGDRWKQNAAHAQWKGTCDQFIGKGYGILGARPLETRFGRARRTAATEEPRRKKARTCVEKVRLQWGPIPAGACRIEFLGDSLLVINWMRGIWKVNFASYSKRVSMLQQRLEQSCRNSLLAPSCDYMDFHRHIFRELNTVADSKASHGRKHGSSWWILPIRERPTHLRIYFDGSFKDDYCGSGWAAYRSADPGLDDDDAWELFAWMAFPIIGKSVTAAELEAYAAACGFAMALIANPMRSQQFFENLQPWSYTAEA